MQNDIRYIYDEMCDTCKKTFKKIIVAIRNDRTKDVNNLALFFCEINPNATIEDDGGVMPIALINCTTNKYVFFWKTNLLDHKGSPKIPVIDHTIWLSQETIDKIPSRRRPNTTALPGDSNPFENNNISAKKPARLEPTFEPTVELSSFANMHELERNNDNVMRRQSFDAKIEQIEDDIDENVDGTSELVVAAKPVAADTATLVKQIQKNQMMSMWKMVQMINRKTAWKIWIILISLFILAAGGAIGGWQLFRYFNNNSNSSKIDITSLGGDLETNVITIEDTNNQKDIYEALITIPVGTGNNQMKPLLSEAVRDPNTFFQFYQGNNYVEDGLNHPVQILINAFKSQKYRGTTYIAVQAKSARIDAGILSQNISSWGTVQVTNGTWTEALDKLMSTTSITDKLTNNQKDFINTAKNIQNNFTVFTSGSVIKGNPATVVTYTITVPNSSTTYKNSATFQITVEWP